MTAAAADYALGTQTTAHTFSIIYKLIEHVEAELEKLLPPEMVYTKLGELRILAVFRTASKFSIVGGRVISGSVRHKAICKILRSGKLLGEATIDQLQSNKKAVGEVTNGNECGMRLETATPIVEGDTIEVYTKEERARRLSKTDAN
jgi:translation initiation factor IF-2